MINYTTPTISLTVEGADLTAFDVYVSIEQGKSELTLSGDALTVTADQEETKTHISFTLTQEQSAMFSYGHSAYVQVNWINESGVRGATEIKAVRILRNLLDEVISYENEG